MKPRGSVRVVLGASFLVLCLLYPIMLWSRNRHKAFPVRRQPTSGIVAEIDSDLLNTSRATDEAPLVLPDDQQIPVEKVAIKKADEITAPPVPQEILSQEVVANTPVTLSKNPGVGTQLSFSGIYVGGSLAFELLGRMKIPPYASKAFREAVALKDAESTIHLHVRMGSAPQPAVANSATPGGSWGHELRLKDHLQGIQNKPISFDIVFAEKHFELFFDKESLAVFEYRFDPLSIDAFRVVCTSCITQSKIAIQFPASITDCYEGFCMEDDLKSKLQDSNATVGIAHSYYINLEHRKDRKAAIEALLSSAGIPFERIDAVNPRALPNAAEVLQGCFDESVCAGQVGCQMSHLKALKRAMDMGLEHIAIFEDDFTFHPYVDLSKIQSAIADTMRLVPEWDVIALSLSISSETLIRGHSVKFSISTTAGLTWMHSAQTTGGYIVRRTMIPRIYNSFLEANCLVKRDYHTAIDQCWKALQMQYLWVAFEPQPGTQAKSFSDIEGRQVDYGLKRL